MHRLFYYWIFDDRGYISCISNDITNYAHKIIFAIIVTFFWLLIWEFITFYIYIFNFLNLWNNLWKMKKIATILSPWLNEKKTCIYFIFVNIFVKYIEQRPLSHLFLAISSKGKIWHAYRYLQEMNNEYELAILFPCLAPTQKISFFSFRTKNW